MSKLPEVTVAPIKYAVSLLPEDDVNYPAYLLFVQRVRGQWGVTDGMGWLSGLQGQWSLDRWDAVTWESLAEVITYARGLARTRTVNGRTVAEAYRLTHPETENES